MASTSTTVTLLVLLLATAVYGNTLHLEVCRDCCCNHCTVPLDIAMYFGDNCEFTATPMWGWTSDVCMNGDTANGHYQQRLYEYENEDCLDPPHSILKQSGGCYSTANSRIREVRQYASLYPTYKIQRCVYYDPAIYPAPDYPHGDYPDLKSHPLLGESSRNYFIVTVIILLMFWLGVYSGWRVYKRLKRRNLVAGHRDELLIEDGQSHSVQGNL